MHRIATLVAAGLMACATPAVAGALQGTGEAVVVAPAAVAPGAAPSTPTSFAPAFSTDEPAGAARAAQGRDMPVEDPAQSVNTGLSRSTLQLLLAPASDSEEKP